MAEFVDPIIILVVLVSHHKFGLTACLADGDMSAGIHGFTTKISRVELVVHLLVGAHLCPIGVLLVRYSVHSSDLTSVEGVAGGVVELDVENIFAVMLMLTVELGEIVRHESVLAAFYHFLAGLGCKGSRGLVFERLSGHLKVGACLERCRGILCGVPNRVCDRKKFFRRFVILYHLGIYIRKRCLLCAEF